MIEQNRNRKKTQDDDTKTIQNLCEICLLYSDIEKGNIPILFCSDEAMKNKIEVMKILKYHSIWYLNLNEKSYSENVDLDYGSKIYFAKKFAISPNISEKTTNLNLKTKEELVIIIALPTEIRIFGDDLINFMVKKLLLNCTDSLYRILESEISKLSIISPNLINSETKKKIERGDKIKNSVQNLIQDFCKEYFSSVIKRADSDSLKRQKALSFLSLNWIKTKFIIEEKGEVIDNKQFSSNEKARINSTIKNPFEILKLSVLNATNELEIRIKSNNDDEMNNIKVKISYIKDYLEKEMLNQEIDVWYSKEDILFIMPVIPHEEEYLFLKVEGANNQKFLIKKIDKLLLN